MRPMVRWTPALDYQLCLLRGAGATWDGIAHEMKLGRNTVLERGRKLGAQKLRPRVLVAAEEHRDRPPRPPGHPETWGLIISGTLLDGETYPYPVFL